MFAFLGLGWGDLFVIIGIALGLVALLIYSIKLILMDNEQRKMRLELSCLREESEQMRDEIKRLHEQLSPSADTGIKQS
jgi:hypothetical protein